MKEIIDYSANNENFMFWHIIIPSSEDSAGHNTSRVPLKSGRLKTHKFSTVKNEIT